MLIACITLEGVNPICHALDVRFSMRMMIAFITLESSLVPLMHDLCCSIPYEFEFLASRTHFFAFLSGETVKRKQAVSPRTHPTAQYIYTYTCTSHVSTCILRFSPSGFFGLSSCLIPTRPLGSHLNTLRVVYVYVPIHTHTSTYTPNPSKIEEIQTTPQLFFCQK